MPHTGFALSPTWGDTLTVSYKLLTKVYSSYGFVEQRAAWVEQPKLSETFTLLEKDKAISTILTSLTYIFPLFPFAQFGTKTGPNVITLDATPLYFNGITYIIDTSGNYNTISSIVGNAITVDTIWGGISSGFFSPGFAGNITEINKEILSSGVIKCTITGEEV